MKKASLVMAVLMFVSLAGCRAVEQDWGAEKNGLRTRLTLLTERCVIGKPIEFRLEMTNVSDSTRNYDDQQADINNSMLIRGPDGEIVAYIFGAEQTWGRAEPIKPGETATLVERFDIVEQYYIGKPGRHTVQHRGERGIGIGEDDIPPSNIVEMHVHPGELTAAGIIVGHLLEILPDKPGLQRYVLGKWELTWRDQESVKPDGRVRGKGIRVGMGIRFSSLMGGPGTGVEVCQMYEPAELESSEPPSVSEYLGSNKWGHVYITVGRDAEKHWPDFREKIIKALEVQNR